MAKVLTHMCMSVDGFVAQPDDSPAELFDWYWNGDVVVPSAQEGMSFSVDPASAAMLQEITSGCGALIAGRRLFDQPTDGVTTTPPAHRWSSSPTARRHKAQLSASRARCSPQAFKKRSRQRRR